MIWSSNMVVFIGGERPGRGGGQCLPSELVDHLAKPDLAALGGDVNLEVQRPHLIRTSGGQPITPPRPDPLLFADAGRPAQALLSPVPANPLAVDH
jgi:hypothetical protein